MKDERKTKEQLMSELAELRQRIAELEVSETERVRAEEELEESKERLETIFDSAQTGILVIDAETHKIVDLNPVAIEMIGVPKERIVGSVCHEFVCPAEKGRCPITDLGQPIDRAERVLIKGDGESIPILKTVTSAMLQGRKHLIESFIDITERKRAEEALWESEEKYRTIFETTGTATVILEEDTTISLANEEFERLSGYSKEEVEGKKSWTEFVVKDDLERMKEYHRLRRIDPNAAPRNYEFRFIDRQGNVRVIFLTIAVIPGTKKSVASLLDITERKRAEEEAQRRLERLQALREIDRAISSSLELKDRLDVLLDRLTDLPHIDGLSVMVLKPGTQELEAVAVRGLSEGFVEMAAARLRDGLPGLVAAQEKPLVITDLIEDERVVYLDLLEREEIVSYVGIPLLAKGELIGVLGIHSRERHLWSQEQTDFLHTLAGQAAIAIENAQAYERLKTQNLQTISALAAAVEAKDPYTIGHSERVTQFAIAIAEKMGLSNDEIETLRVAGLLHDIGKIGIPDSVLNKPARLTSAERVMINSHPVTSAEIVGRVEALAHLVPIIRHHHEWYDGKGYPDGLKGKRIPLGARILAVADGFEAMTSERPYRWALTEEEALAELEKGAGTQWDPKVVEAFFQMLEGSQ